MNILKIVDRFKEPSSFAAIAAVLVGVGVNIEQTEWWGPVVYALAGLAGLAAILLKEKGPA